MRIKQKPALCKQNMLLFGLQQKISATSFNHYFHETRDFNVRQRSQGSLLSTKLSPEEPHTQEPFSGHLLLSILFCFIISFKYRVSSHISKQSSIIFPKHRTKYPRFLSSPQQLQPAVKTKTEPSLSAGSPHKAPEGDHLHQQIFTTLFPEIPILQTTSLKSFLNRSFKIFSFVFIFTQLKLCNRP